MSNCGRRDFGSSGSGSSDSLDASSCFEEERESRPEVLVMDKLFSEVSSRKLTPSLADADISSGSVVEDTRLRPQLLLLLTLRGTEADTPEQDPIMSSMVMETGDVAPDTLAGVKGRELGSSVDWKMLMGLLAARGAEVTSGVRSCCRV